MSVSSRKASVFLLVVLLPVAAFTVWHGYQGFQERRAEAQAEADGEVPTPKGNSNWKFVTEEHWLVDETARDITEMLAFAADKGKGEVKLVVTPEKGTPEAFDLQAKVAGTDVKADLRWKDYIWSPAEYGPWAEKLIAALKLNPAPSTEDSTLIQTLTSPTPETIQREAKRISEALTKAPLDAGLHEQAALITAAFALREMAGTYCDNRREICRIAAHLSIAQTLRPPNTGPLRKLADAALQTLVERETPALQLLAELEHDSTPGMDAWVRALRLRNTADWRTVSADPTLLEQLEVFIARTRSANAEFALQWLAPRKPAPVHDWRRVVLQGNFGVERGHQFAKDSIPREIQSLQTDWAAQFGKKLPDSEIMNALNESPARSVGKQADGQVGMQVLGWDMWSAQHQRHFAAAIHATITFLRDLWGVPEYRDAQKFVRQQFAGLRLMPLMEPELIEAGGDTRDISKRVTQLIADHPEAISAAAWGRLLRPHGSTPALAIMSPESWVRPSLPFGTTFDVCSRTGCLHLASKQDTAWWDKSVALSPASYDLRFAKLWTFYGTHAPLDVVEATYAPLADYSFWALDEIGDAQKDKSPKYIETMKKICEYDTDRYVTIGRYYLEHNQPEQAAEAYQKSFDLCQDRVQVSNTSEWLVNYLDDHGQKEKALAIAKEGAEVYSLVGLETMANLQEKHGQLHEAEDYFAKIAERYDDSGLLNAFYNRNLDKDPKYKEITQKLQREAFPDGLKKVSLADFKTPPVDGTVLTDDSSLAQAAGLRAGDVIVAIEGYEAHSMKQYMFVRGLSADPHFTLIVWKGNAYRQIAANVPNRRFKVGLQDYHGR